MRLKAELRRRNVIRMAGLYLVGAWLTNNGVSGWWFYLNFTAPRLAPQSILSLRVSPTVSSSES